MAIAYIASAALKSQHLPGPHRGVWNAAALSATKEVILCEALIDALTFWCAGFRNVTASYGVEGFTADHLACFKQCGIERVLLPTIVTGPVIARRRSRPNS
jgi:DNA primase